MKRLRKRAWDKITLYHGTSSQILSLIASDGQIFPGGYINSTSNGLVSDPNGNNSHSKNQNGIYLAATAEVAERYVKGALLNSPDDIMPSVAVILKLDIDTDTLTPDYDDWPEDAVEQWSENNKGSELWKGSLDEVRQVVHNGPIDISSIESVTFLPIYEEGAKLELNFDNDEVREIIESIISMNIELSLQEAIDKINALNEKVNEK